MGFHPQTQKLELLYSIISVPQESTVQYSAFVSMFTHQDFIYRLKSSIHVNQSYMVTLYYHRLKLVPPRIESVLLQTQNNKSVFVPHNRCSVKSSIHLPKRKVRLKKYNHLVQHTINGTEKMYCCAFERSYFKDFFAFLNV